MTASIASAEQLRVGVIGFGWMGRVHARAYTRLAQHYPTLAAAPELVAVADNAPDDRLGADQVFGFRDVHADWRELVARDDIDVISVTGPNFIHRDVSVAVAEHGKHLWVEKPQPRQRRDQTDRRRGHRTRRTVHRPGSTIRQRAPSSEPGS